MPIPRDVTHLVLVGQTYACLTHVHHYAPPPPPLPQGTSDVDGGSEVRERGGTREEEEEEEEGGRRRRGSSPSPASPSGPAQQLQQLEIEDEDEVAGRDNFEDNPRGGGGVEGESIPAARTFRLSFPFVRCSTSAARPRGGILLLQRRVGTPHALVPLPRPIPRPPYLPTVQHPRRRGRTVPIRAELDVPLVGLVPLLSNCHHHGVVPDTRPSGGSGLHLRGRCHHRRGADVLWEPMCCED